MDRCLLTFIVGIGISLYLPITTDSFSVSSISIWAVTVGFVAFGYAVGNRLPRTRSVATAIAAVFCGISVATATLNCYSTQANQVLATSDKQWVDVTVIDVPKRYRHHTVFTGQIEQTEFSSATLFAGQPKVLLSWYGEQGQTVALGQRWRVKVALKHFRNYWNEGSRDYLAMMRRRGVVARGSVSEAVLLNTQNSVRSRLQAVFSGLDSPHRGIVAALGIGVRDLLTAEQRINWQYNGLTHALAISGLHLSLVGWAGLMLGQVLVGRWQGRRAAAQLEQRSVQPLSLLLALAIAWGYAWLADFSIATVRALIMFSVVVVHRLLHLQASIWQLLLRTVAILLLFDPLALLDAGFWLSITALLTIFTTIWRWRSAGRTNKWYALVRLQWMFLVVMAPLSLHWFGGVSLVAPVINLLVLPVISLWLLPLTLLGVLAELSFAHQFADNLWAMATFPLQAISPLLAWTAALSWSWWQPPVPLPLSALFLLMLLVLMPLSQRWLKAVLLVTLPLAITAWHASRPRSEQLYLHVLDVGQSQAIVVERAGRAWLIDTGVGYRSGYTLAATVIEPFLRQRQLHLEGVWVSHSDRDHSGGVGYLQSRYPQVQWFGAMTQVPCESGMEGVWNDVQWHVIWPRAGKREGSSNNRSCVLQLRYRDFSFLLPGDIEFSAERDIAESAGFPSVDVLIAPHHGSRTSSGWLMLKQVQPSLILISNGKHKGFNFPHRYTTGRYQHMQRLWFNTKDFGQLTVISDGYHWQLTLPMAERRQRKLYQSGD